MQASVAPAPTSPGQATAPVAAQGPATPGTPGTLAGPTTELQMLELRARRSEISSQLGNVTSRRSDLANQLRDAAPGTDRAGLEARIAALDQRIIELEGELNVTGRQLANARGQAATIVDDPPTPQTSVPDADQMTAIAIVFTIAVLMPLAVAFGRSILRRAGRAAEQPSQQVVQRLDRMEQGIEAIAIEVERISENQRFVTRLLGEGAAPDAMRRAPGQPEPARLERAAVDPRS